MDDDVHGLSAMPFLSWVPREMNVNLLGLRVASVFGVVALLLPTDPQFWVACTVGITTIGSIVLQILKNRQDVKMRQLDDARYERDHAELRAGISTGTETIRRDIAANTALTSDVGAKADAAYEAANNVNEKIATLAAGPVTRSLAVTTDTNETVHRIEEKV
jgi:hypothetical protein